MTAAVRIATDTVVYDAVFDTTIARIAIVTGSVADAVTGQPIDNVSVRANRTSVLARVMAGGFFAASGAIERIFPDHPTVAWSMELTFTATRYRSQTVVVPIAAAASFPVNAGAVLLRPLPVRIEGRVTKESDRTGIGGAMLAVKSGTPALLLRTQAHVDHPLGVPITAVTLANAGALRSVNAAAPGRATLVRLDNVASLAPGDILRFGIAAAEYAIVSAVDAAASTVTLRYPLTRSYAVGTSVQAVTATAVPPPMATTRSIEGGDGLLVLSAPLAAGAIEISDPPRLEYHDVNVVADADGFFAVDGIAGVRALTLNASADEFAPRDLDWTIDTSRPMAALSFRLKP